MDENENKYVDNEKQINKVETVDSSIKEKEVNNLDPYKSRKALIYCCFAFIGLFNNLGYTLMITGAQQFSSGQVCPYGDKCQFAHGSQELRLYSGQSLPQNMNMNPNGFSKSQNF